MPPGTTHRLRLDVTDHDRGATGMTYVYPVVSRRARGVSIGINLNPNNLCNWACAYCQVPGLGRGKGPALDLKLLQTELDSMLGAVVRGDFLEQRAPEGSRRLADVAFSGNGEPTTSPDFARAVEAVGEVLTRFELVGRIPLVLITNGSMLDRANVVTGVRRLAELGGEIWFKLDSATADGARRINGVRLSPAAHLGRLVRVAQICPTWIQTCVFATDGQPPARSELEAYLAAVEQLVAERAPIRGVHLYTLARPALQPGADRLSALPERWLADFASELEARGLHVVVSA